ncbi:MAG: PilZ domain-containing protein [Gammaproteobacteria bacterium]|nr:PilZ domain-containing protein [Gammaproteobacteria bacterium]
MHENRTSPRKRVHEKIQVVDLNSGEVMGNLVNISTGGLMLLSEVPLAPNRLFQLSLVLPSQLDGAASIEFGVECLWVQDAEESNAPCWAGFQIIDISEQSSQLIAQLMAAWTE